MSQEARQPIAFGKNLIISPIEVDESKARPSIILAESAKQTIFTHQTARVISVGDGYASMPLPFEPGDTVCYPMGSEIVVNLHGGGKHHILRADSVTVYWKGGVE